MAKPENRRNDRARDKREGDELTKVTISMNRVTKVVKGGRNMRQAALVAVGDKNGRIGVGQGKATEATEAINKAETAAKRAMFTVPMVGHTIPHEIIGEFGSGRVLMMPAAPGTGVIAGGPARIILELAGIQDIRTKSLGSNNPINNARATLDGLMKLRTKETIAALRGKTPAEVSRLVDKPADAKVEAPVAPVEE